MSYSKTDEFPEQVPQTEIVEHDFNDEHEINYGKTMPDAVRNIRTSDIPNILGKIWPTTPRKYDLPN